MGIRLYFRNKDRSEEHEYCLGKLYGYIEANNYLWKSVNYLKKINAIQEFVNGFKEYYDYPDCINDAFIEICDDCKYNDYGEFFKLTTQQLCGFLYFYRMDWNFYNKDFPLEKDARRLYDADFFERVLFFIGEHKNCGDIWLFRLGA